MAFVGLDPSRVRTLSTTMRTASDASDALSADVTKTLELAELTSNTPALLNAEAIEMEKVGVVLAARADLAEGLELDIEGLADALGVTVAEAEAAIADSDSQRDSADPLLGLVAQDHFLFTQLPRSIRDLAIGLPPEGQNPTVDAAVSRLNETLLPALLRGDAIDPDDLSDQQRADLKILARALGGDDVTITGTRREKYSGAQGDDEYRTVTEQVPITDLDSDVVLQFVQGRLIDDARLGRVADQLDQVAAAAGQEDLSTLSAETGLSEPDVRKLLDVIELTAFVGGADVSIVAGSAADGLTIDQANQELRELRDELSSSEQGARISGAVGGSAGAGSVTFGFATVVGGAVLTGAALGLTILGFGAFALDYVFSSRAERIKKEIEEKEKAERDRFREQSDDADNNGFPDFGDPNDTKDPNDPNDTGGSGLI